MFKMHLCCKVPAGVRPSMPAHKPAQGPLAKNVFQHPEGQNEGSGRMMAQWLAQLLALAFPQ